MSSTTHTTTFEQTRDCSKQFTRQVLKHLGGRTTTRRRCCSSTSATVSAVVDLTQFDSSTPEAKDYLAEVVLPTIVRTLGGVRAAVSFCAWQVSHTDDAELEQ